jgi:hypothetical protein
MRAGPGYFPSASASHATRNPIKKSRREEFVARKAEVQPEGRLRQWPPRLARDKPEAGPAGSLEGEHL